MKNVLYSQKKEVVYQRNLDRKVCKAPVFRKVSLVNQRGIKFPVNPLHPWLKGSIQSEDKVLLQFEEKNLPPPQPLEILAIQENQNAGDLQGEDINSSSNQSFKIDHFCLKHALTSLQKFLILFLLKKKRGYFLLEELCISFFRKVNEKNIGMVKSAIRQLKNILKNENENPFDFSYCGKNKYSFFCNPAFFS